MTYRPVGRFRPKVRLWIKLALFGVMGVVLTHSLHLIIARRMVERALTEEQARLGRQVGRLVAHQATDSVLVKDALALHELVASVVSQGDVAYCFVVTDGRVVASSFRGPTPSGLVGVRAHGDLSPVVVRDGPLRYLDLAEPVTEASGSVVRIGLDMSRITATGRRLALFLGSLALAVAVMGCVAAFWVGRSIARPLGELVAAADRFDPADHVRVVDPKGTDEIADVTVRFNEMMERLAAAQDEQVRNRKQATATERLAALGSLVGGVAHEVNNPLAGIKNCVRRLEKNDLPEAKRREYLELMGEGLDRIEEVVQRLLDFGRPRALRLVAAPLAALSMEAPKLLRPVARKRNIEIVEPFDLEPAAACVLADAKQIGQALVNLLLNAIHATEDGGTVRIVLRERPTMLGISVEDDGPGIPAELRDKVLLPYFSTKPEGQGTGLGLSVTRSIVDAHGGELTFEFPARGTVATIWLRRAPEDPRN